MSLWSSLLRVVGLQAGEPRTAPGPADDFWYTDSPGHIAAGVRVSPESAMRVAAVFACVRVIAESVAQLPLITYERQPRGKSRAPEHPFARLMKQPNRWQNRYQFVEMMTGHAVLRGNGYALILPGEAGPVGELLPLHPGRMQVEQTTNMRLRYTYRWPDGTVGVYDQDDVFHLHGLSTDGICGINPIENARRAVGIAIAAEEFGAKQFSQRPMMSGILSHPQTFSSPEVARRVGRSFDASTSGANAHRTAVLEEGMTWTKMGMSNRDAEFLVTRKFQVTDIARWFRVPPHMIGDLDRATFSNIEQQSIEFVTYTLMPWLKRWEATIGLDLILDDEHFAEFLVDGLLRGDLSTRAAAYQLALNGRWMTVNEVRALENMNPVEWGDEPNDPQGAPTPEREAQQPPPPNRLPPEEDDEDEDEDEQARVPVNRVRAHVNGNGASHE